ncbi:RDR1 [Symbiodinium necroappetens]|uniref:RNA-dependent RNA polymerase n=1 Tax=Symbiodinium necroappetens TaxID=1628268 RepID=A0A813AGR7_9DINO|nr:RDR1 [Symbiodinium necroappetens]
MTRGQVEAHLREARLQSVIPKLDDLGVEEMEDLLILEDEDVDAAEKLNLVEKRKLKNLLKTLRGGSLPWTDTSPLTEPPSAVQTRCSSPVFSDSGTWDLAGSREFEMDDSWVVAMGDADFTASSDLKAEKPDIFEVPHFKITGGKPQRQEVRKFFYRPIHWRMRPKDGWSFITMELPGPTLKGPYAQRFQELQTSVEQYRELGFQHDGRNYYYVSSSKPAEFPRGPTAWLASPPGGGGPEQIGELIGFPERLSLEETTDEMPYPVFRLRARGKQLFSSIIATIPAAAVTVQLQKNFEEEGVRDDGAGEADPAILQALAYASNTRQEETGLSRSIPGSAQIRCGGLKGMLLRSKRLAATGRVEVPENMLKFGPTTFDTEQLSVVSFSRVRPTSLGLDVVLRLEACGCNADTFLKQHQQCLNKISGMKREDFFGQLYFAEYENDPEMEAVGEHSAELTSRHYIGTFLEMLIAGYDPQQHPLLEVILRQKEAALKRAKKQVHIRGCWSARGHPEPRESDADGERPLLRDNEVFLMVPCDAEETGWRALTGPVIVNYLSDRDPYALRLAVAKDSEALRSKCEPGILFFSRVGCPLQKNLSWDFDGDYFQIITDEEIVKSFSGHTSPLPEPEYEDDLKDMPVSTWVDVNASFLSEYLQRDRMGLLHYHWQLIAGQGPKAASSEEARQVAAAYAKSLDVEKGKRCPKQARFEHSRKWDFMNGGDLDNPSPTAAGFCFRAASRAEEEFKAVRDRARSSGKDPDLDKAWQRMEEELGQKLCQQDFAKNVRGEFIERVKAECNKAERIAREKHPNSSGEAVFKDEWIRELRARTQEKAEKLESQRKVGLTQVALAGWHLKYVDKKVCERDADPDPSFPWTLFRQELAALKKHYQPCPMGELRRNHLFCRRLQRGAAEQLEEKVRQAIDGLKFNMKCQECSRDRKMLLDRLKSRDSFSEIVAAVKEVSGRGELIRVGIDDLRYCKDVISDVFDHGLNAGMKLKDLVENLLSDGSPSDMELTAVKFHGHLYVIEGNKRLWCLKEAQKEAKQKLKVSVRVPDLYLGFVQRQEHKEPVLPYFLQRFRPRSGGRDILLQEHVPTVNQQADIQQAEPFRTRVPKVNEQADITEAGNKVLGCGKYKGRTYAEACEDADYRKWVMQNISDTSSPEMQKLKGYILRRSNAEQSHVTSSRSSVPTVNQQADIQQAGNKILGCGKHKGRTYGEAFLDTGYRNWVMQNISDTSSPDMCSLKAFCVLSLSN